MSERGLYFYFHFQFQSFNRGGEGGGGGLGLMERRILRLFTSQDVRGSMAATTCDTDGIRIKNF